MQSALQEPNLENNMTEERRTRRIRHLEEEKRFAEMQASKELDKRSKTPEQKVASSITVLSEERTSPYVDGTSPVTDDVLEPCGMAELREETAMRTSSPDEMS